MKIVRFVRAALALAMVVAASQAHALDAFPGAEGFGATVSGGRGGTVYHVTNLNNTGSGSLRNASAMSNVTIVFDVGGYIVNASKLGFTGSNVTIAGQTAPGGIGVRGQGTSVGGNNIIIRHFRSRPGKGASSAPDSFNINNDVDNLIVDHCSIEFGVDENNSMDRPRGVTNQWSFIAWGLQTHSAGSLLYANNTTVHHTLWAHNHTRNPKSRYGLLDWVNNTIYDWDIPYIIADADSDVHWSNVDRCYFISGASGQNRAFTSGQVDRNSGQPTYSMWLNQTLTDFDTNGILDGTDKGYGVVSGSLTHTASRYTAPQVTTQDALLAHKLVLSLGGATPWARDEVDTLLVNDVKTQTRRIITRESDLPISAGAGFGTLGGVSASPDSDGDGMPDYFEIAMGFSPTAASNNGDADSNGYTNLEEYLNWLGAPNAKTAGGTAIDINLKKYTAGFGNAATYTASNPSKGTVSVLGDGFTARFTPGSGQSGLGGFDFTVNDGSAATIHIGVLILGTSSAPTVTPDPMTFSSAPAANGASKVTMTASAASSSGGVQYYFTCTGGANGHDSGWQTATTYQDAGLVAGTAYTYTVKARDAVFLNETAASAPASATTTALPSVPAPRAWWKMDEASGDSVLDSSGNNNTGTLFGAPKPVREAGKFGSALNFTAATDGVHVPSSATIDFGDQDMSVSFWLKAPTTMTDNTQQEILIKGTIASPPTGSGKRYEFYRKRSSGTDNFRFTVDDDATKSEITVLSTTVCTGNWVHVCGVRNTVTNILTLYANGVQIGTTADATGSISQTETLFMSGLNAADRMAGSLDDVKIFNVALTGDQVTADFLGDSSPPAAPRKLSALASAGAVGLKWAPNTEVDLANYNLMRGVSESGPYTTIATGLTTNTYNDSGLTDGAVYFYVVSAVDTNGNESDVSNEVDATVGNATDVTAPQAPTGLTAAAGLRKVNLDWEDNTDLDLQSYAVMRGTVASGPYTAIAQGVLASNYSDATAAVGTTYFYVVTALDEHGNPSADPSNEASAAAVGSITLQAEDNLFGDGSAPEATNAGWHGTGYINFAGAPSTTGYNEYQHVDGVGGSATLSFRNALASGSRAASLIVNGVSQTITATGTGAFTTWAPLDAAATLNNGPVNTIRIQVTGNDFSNVDELTVTPAAPDAVAPSAPTSLSATGGPGKITLNWADNTEIDLASYKVKRSTVSGSGYVAIATGVPVSGFVDFTATPGTTYFYVVTAVDNSGNESGAGAQASAAADAPLDPDNAVAKWAEFE